MDTLQTAVDLRDLLRSEHLVLFGFRMMAIGHDDCPALQSAFRGLLGSDADDALCSLHTFVRMVGWGGARRLRLHVPGCCMLSDDERSLVAVVAAAQISLFDGEENALRDSLSLLRGAQADESCLMAAQAVAAALACNGLHLPIRVTTLGIATASAAVTLH